MVALSLALALALAACGRNRQAREDPGAAASQAAPPALAATSAHATDGGPEGAQGGAAPLVARRELPPPPPPEPPPGPESAGSCPRRADAALGFLVSPDRVHDGETARVLFATLEGEAAIAVRVEDRAGDPVAVEAVVRRGVPASTLVRFEAHAEQAPYVVVAGREGEGMRCAKVSVARGGRRAAPPGPSLDRVWKLRRGWGPAEEALYSAWVRELFWAPPGEPLAFDQLTRVTADPRRNVLHGALGWGEDDADAGLRLIPDCADAPYFLRAYFAWKRGLPFGFRRCSRGTGGPPVCFDLHSNLAAPELADTWRRPQELEGPAGPELEAERGTGGQTETKPDPPKIDFDQLMVMDRFFRRTVAWGVHSGNGRCAYDDPRSDFYPLALTRRSLRPGTTYADPYGHLFVLVELVEQRGPWPGILYAIDGQPDGSITRKRFWEGNFLWNPDPTLGGSGFKAFRPLVRVESESGELVVALDNAAIATRRGYGDVDSSVGSLSADAFYDRMDRLISPAPIDPFAAQDAAIVALHEAARVRVTSVNNGERYRAAHPEEIIEMPRGHDVFETTGPWENFATPARDLRLLIAMDLVANFDRKVARQPEAYGIEPGPAVEATVAALRREREVQLASAQYAVTYTGSHGGEVRLTLAELFARVEALEIAYNPNDCVERRWGAPEGSEELARCRARAPEEQRARMEAYRSWFATRRRPARGDEGPPVSGQ